MGCLRTRFFAPAVGLAALGVVLAGGVPTLAQDATPPATTEALPVAIHQGTCSQPAGQPAYTIGAARGFIDAANQVIPREQYRGTLTAAPVLTSGIGIGVKLDDLLGGTPYVLLVHRSAQDYGSYLACGELGGPVVNDQLVVALRPLANSGYAGLAILTRKGDQTVGNVYVFAQVEGFSGAPQAAAPAASPTAGPTPPPTPTPAPTATGAASPTETPAAGG